MFRYLLFLFFATQAIAADITQPFTPIPYTIRLPKDKMPEDIESIDTKIMVDLATYPFSFYVDFHIVTPKEKFVFDTQYVYSSEPCIEQDVYLNGDFPFHAWNKTKDGYEITLVPEANYDDVCEGEIWLHIVEMVVKFKP